MLLYNSHRFACKGDGETIKDDGMERLFADLGISADDVLTLLIAWQFGAETLGEFTKEEWINGMNKLRYAACCHCYGF